MKHPADIAEDDLHAAIAALLNRILSQPAEWTTFPAGGYALGGRAAGRLKRIGTKPGWPDILIAHNGHVLGIELKRRSGRLSDAQKEMHPRLEAAGIPVQVCRSIEDVIAALDAFCIPHRAVSI